MWNPKPRWPALHTCDNAASIEQASSEHRTSIDRASTECAVREGQREVNDNTNDIVKKDNANDNANDSAHDNVHDNPNEKPARSQRDASEKAT